MRAGHTQGRPRHIFVGGAEPGELPGWSVLRATPCTHEGVDGPRTGPDSGEAPVEAQGSLDPGEAQGHPRDIPDTAPSR